MVSNDRKRSDAVVTDLKCSWETNEVKSDTSTFKRFCVKPLKKKKK